MSRRTTRAYFSTSLATLFLFAACGGGQAPAESPEVSPEPAPAATESPPAESDDAGPGQHTMPDGSVMPGSEHPEGSEEHQHQH